MNNLQRHPLIVTTFLRKLQRFSKLHTSTTGLPMYVDIGANLLDERYQGIYHDKQLHDPDIDGVLKRAFENSVEAIMITSSTLQESKDALDMTKKDKRLFSTVGVHPTRCSQEFGPNSDDLNDCIHQLRIVLQDGISSGRIAAIGELGLDYDRLHFSDKETQKKGFIAQLELAKEFSLPLFLHNRNCGDDVLDILNQYYFQDGHTSSGGVVHSFTDSIELAQKFIDAGLYIGINGCSLKTLENLAVVKQIPLDRILLETDCPWCDIRPTHAGSMHIKTQFVTKPEKKYDVNCCVKGRYEPCHIVQVAEVIAGVKGITKEEVAVTSKRNAFNLFKSMRILSPLQSDL